MSRNSPPRSIGKFVRLACFLPPSEGKHIIFSIREGEGQEEKPAVRGRFADAGISFHFIFMEKKPQRVFGGTMREQSENHDLLSYTPGAYSPDGGFRTIAVRVKGGNYAVSNRLGCYAR